MSTPATTVLTAADITAVTGRPTPGAALRVPALLRHRCTGRLLLAHDLRPVTTSDDAWRTSGGALPGDLPNPNSLWLRASDDDGATWSAPAPLLPDPEALPGIVGLSDPVLLEGPSGTLHLLAAASADVGLFGAHVPTRPWRAGQAPEPGTLRLLHATSHDVGATWAWTDLTDLCLPGPVFPEGCVLFPASGHGTVLGPGPAVGRLVAPLVAALPAPSRSGQDVHLRSVCLLSDDDGITWRLGRPVPVATSAGRSLAGGARTSGTDEHAVVALDGATVLMSARDGAYGGTRLTSLSVDGAATWSPAQREADVPDPGCNAGLIALVGGRVDEEEARPELLKQRRAHRPGRRPGPAVPRRRPGRAPRRTPEPAHCQGALAGAPRDG
ncbi:MULTISPECIES: exo-alpha-sialidase [Actinomyces]|uniref:exo-alpha-sialidase n=1 Tax=Actinomyces respiraculi TaxID=2744574 RepID=A0A7T0PWH9_9ACTO|nr:MULTISPECIES: sialidase family protein [Actinomyces]QPL04865.1 exo-alpha-sialidase [Actinomyces respiraculi]